MRVLAFSLLRALSSERFTSGTLLATEFAVSRSAVSAALKEAANAGVEIFSLTRQGYRLGAPLDFIDVARVATAMGLIGNQANRIDLEVIDCIDSTNTELLRRLNQGAPSGSVLVAEMQSAGRGRRGRVWQSSLGGSLAFSILWRFDLGLAQLGGLSLVVGLAVKRALDRFGIEAQLKWPNDIWLAQKKCGGILIETHGELMGPVTAVIGIGLNVKLPMSVISQLDQPVTDLASHAHGENVIERNALLAAVLCALIEALDIFSRDGFAAFRQAWIAAHALHGAVVEVSTADGKIATGRVIDVAATGALIVDVNGQVRTLSSEEVSLRPTASAP